MDRLDARLRAMAEQETFPLPEGYEAVMDELEERARQGMLRPAAGRQGKRMLLLAALAAALLAVTAVSAEFWHVRLGEVSVGREESRYDVEADLPGVPMEAFSEQVEEALAEIRQAFRAYQPGDSRYPGSWSRKMDTWEACEAFLGFSVTNPLEGQEALAPKTRNAHGEPFAPYEVSLLGSARGELEQISVEAVYEFEGGGVSLQVIFLPEGGESSRLTHGFVWRGQVDFDAAEAQTGSGAPVTIVVPTVEDRDTDRDFTSVESCFILGNGLYLLDVSIHASDREEEVRAELDGLLALF